MKKGFWLTARGSQTWELEDSLRYVGPLNPGKEKVEYLICYCPCIEGDSEKLFLGADGQIGRESADVSLHDILLGQICDRYGRSISIVRDMKDDTYDYYAR